MTRLLIALTITCTHPAFGADRSLKGNPELEKYFEEQVSKTEQRNSLENYQTTEEWDKAKPQLRGQLFDMLGLRPLPERTPLRAETAGSVRKGDFRVEKLHFQSMPGLYVTANLYLPGEIDGPLPAILYVCGHARVKKDAVSFGNKVGYQHHGAWYARNGYACLTIDTLQLGEIEGIHHGTYRYDRWWWNAYGYTPAGVEAWNCIRALDYLETRPEIDSKRIGVTGRSGGGAYSWWIAALDDRIRCSVPVAGITTLRNHVVDGCVEGHCDCMYMTNRYRWDYATVAALVAPRPLLISNSDKDSIFPLDGVVEIHRQVRHIYRLYDQPEKLGLQITEGPHKDTQELRVHAFRWMNRWLKNDDSLIETTATKFFEPEELQVFAKPVKDERNTRIDEDFVTLATTPDEESQERILSDQKSWQTDASRTLMQTCFAAWPSDRSTTGGGRSEPLALTSSSGLIARRIHFSSENHVPLFVDVFEPAGARTDSSTPQNVLLHLPPAETWPSYSEALQQGASPDVLERVKTAPASDKPTVAVFFPRGCGPHAWVGDRKKQTQIRRRFQLLGTTLDAMRIYDIRVALAAIRSGTETKSPITVVASGTEGWLGLMSMITDPAATEGRFTSLSADRERMPVFPDIARKFSREELVALALAKGRIQMKDCPETTTALAKHLSEDRRWTGGTLEIQ